MTLWEPLAIAIIAATFALAGAVKGVIGLGLPTVSLGILTATLDLTTAMALLLVPSFVTNLWQGLVGGHLVAICQRIGLFLLLAFATVWIGGLVIGRVDLTWLSALLGLLLVAYASLSLTGVRLRLSASQDRFAGPLFGAVNGVLTGMTGSFVVPGVMYLQAIGLPRDQLVQSMGILFTLSDRRAWLELTKQCAARHRQIADLERGRRPRHRRHGRGPSDTAQIVRSNI